MQRLEEQLIQLFASVEKIPSQLRHKKKDINAILHRAADEEVSELLNKFYEDSNGIPNTPTAIYNKQNDIAEIADICNVFESQTGEKILVDYLTEERPSAITKLESQAYLEIPSLSAYKSYPGKYTFSVLYDIPLTFNSKQDPVLIKELSSPHADAIYAAGGRRLWNERHLGIDRALFIHDEFVGYNYCHWLLDWLPRIHTLELMGADFSRDKIVLTREPTQFQKQTLAMLNIKPTDVVVADHKKDGEHQFVTSSSFLGTSGTRLNYKHALHGGASWAATFLKRSLYRSSQDTGPLNIILNREGSRRLVFDEETKSLLEREGFKTVFCEKIPIDQQINVFRRARKIISAHGAGLSNLVFCEENTAVLEIFPSNYSTSAYCVVATTVKLRYSCAISKSIITDPPRNHIRDYDLIVNMSTIQTWLNKG